MSQWAAPQTLNNYWGRRGGGSSFLRACYYPFEPSQCDVKISFRSDLQQVDEILQTNTFARFRLTGFALDFSSKLRIFRMASLKEQLENYEYKYASESFSRNDFVKALNDALEDKAQPSTSLEIVQELNEDGFLRCLEIE